MHVLKKFAAIAQNLDSYTLSKTAKCFYVGLCLLSQRQSCAKIFIDAETAKKYDMVLDPKKAKQYREELTKPVGGLPPLVFAKRSGKGYEYQLADTETGEPLPCRDECRTHGYERLELTKLTAQQLKNVFLFHVLYAVPTDEGFLTACPYCGNDNKLNVVLKDGGGGLWGCTKGSCGKKGNLFTFVQKKLKRRLAETPAARMRRRNHHIKQEAAIHRELKTRPTTLKAMNEDAPYREQHRRLVAEWEAGNEGLMGDDIGV
jgi:hypothetical protein